MRAEWGFRKNAKRQAPTRPTFCGSRLDSPVSGLDEDHVGQTLAAALAGGAGVPLAVGPRSHGAAARGSDTLPAYVRHGRGDAVQPRAAAESLRGADGLPRLRRRRAIAQGCGLGAASAGRSSGSLE